MGLFSTVLHIYNRSQADTLKELKNDLQLNHSLMSFSKVDISNSSYQNVLDNEVYAKPGLFYLVTQLQGNWTSIVELNVSIDNPFYLYDLANTLSKQLDTYALSFHLHDDDVLYYNLDNKGESLDGYNSDFQYFHSEPVAKDDIVAQRHSPEHFFTILPKSKTIEGLNDILNEGMWSAFDNEELDEEGCPIDDDKYYVDEQDRFERVGKYLEIFSKDDYPFADWYSNLTKFNLDNCYLLKANR
jgi:hypothetical protein